MAIEFELINQPKASDLNPARGIDAYRWMSFTPERRVAGDIEAYVGRVLDFALMLRPYVETEAQAAEAAAQVERFRLKSIEWCNTLWAASSRTASPMITGPAKFPVARNNKALDAEHKKVGAWLDWLPRARTAAVKAVKAAGQPPAPGSDKPAEVITVGDVQIVTNFEVERIQIVFPGKPDAETIGKLRGAGWNWSPKNGAWQRMITAATMRSARQIVGDPLPAPTAAPPALGTYRTMGRDFAITAAFETDAEVNAYLAKNPGEGVLGEEGGMVLIASNSDKGQPVA